MSDIKGYGKKGENIVARYLKKNGFIITKTNYRTRYGEIDIIAEHDDLLLFVEVKTRNVNAPISGEEAVGFQKQKKIKAAAAQFLSIIDGEYNARFDVAVVTVLEENEKPKYRIKYIKNAFM